MKKQKERGPGSLRLFVLALAGFSPVAGSAQQVYLVAIPGPPAASTGSGTVQPRAREDGSHQNVSFIPFPLDAPGED